jgi:SagB-type dehydrogenase family enzyme
MAPGDTARLYHRLSSYEPTREFQVPIEDPLVLQDFVASDMDRVPAPCKSYAAELPVVALPREWPRVTAPATAVLSGAYDAAPGRLDLPALARLLHLSLGVVRTAHRKGRLWYFRAAGSAGGRAPYEVYVSARGIDGLPDGVHWYDPLAHALRQVGPAAGGEATTLVVTGIPWRTGWKYAERSFRHIYWDSGTMLAQTLALAESAGLRPRLWTAFPDADVTRLVGADGVHEFPVALVGLGDGAPAIAPQGEAARGDVDTQAPVEFPLVTMAQRAGDADALGDPWPAAAPLPAPPPASPDLDEVLLTRGSTRRMDASATVPRALFEFAMTAAMRGARDTHFVAVHGVDGLDPGLYRWPDLDDPCRRGPLRETMLRVCWDQDLGRDAAFVVFGAADVEQLDDRGYREAQLGSGIVEGRLHIAAYALGIGATGMTFLDSEIAPLVGEPLAGLLFTCVGVPRYRHKAGGRPGEPVFVVAPEAGLTVTQ